MDEVGVGVEEELFGLAADGAGLVRRECRSCHRIFKIRAGELDGEVLQRALGEKVAHVNAEELSAHAPERSCPYCGERGPEQAFLTAQQRARVEKRAQHWQREIRHVQLLQPLQTLSVNPNVTYLAVAPERFEGAEAQELDTLRPFPLLCCRDSVRVYSFWNGPVHCYFCGTLYEVNRVAPGFLARLESSGIDI